MKIKIKTENAESSQDARASTLYDPRDKNSHPPLLFKVEKSKLKHLNIILQLWCQDILLSL